MTHETAQASIDEHNTQQTEIDRIKVAQMAAAMTKSESKHLECPMCGGKNIEKISKLNRTASVLAFGLASSKIGKQYQCKSCKHKW